MKKLKARVASIDLPAEWVLVDEAFAESLAAVSRRELNVAVAAHQTIERDVPNVGDVALDPLDDHGVIRVGEAVEPGTILVGITEERGGEATPEEKLLRAIFGEAAGALRDVSLRSPAWCSGVVESVDRVGDQITVTIASERPLEVGDRLLINGDEATVVEIRALDTDIGWSGGSSALVERHESARDALFGRSIGPYDPVTQRPVLGRDEFGAQPTNLTQNRLLASNAPWMFWEMCTLKSDAVSDRTRAFEALIKGTNFATDYAPSAPVGGGAGDIFAFFEKPGPRPGEAPHAKPEAVSVLKAWLWALGLDVKFFDERVSASFVTDDDVRHAAHGKIRTPEGLDDSGKPVPGGLLCEKIFGPCKDYECACGKYKRMKHRGVVCEKCGVEVIQSRVRRERFALHELPEPCEDHVLERPAFTVLPILPPDIRGDLHMLYSGVIFSAPADVQRAVRELRTALAERVNKLWTELFARPVDYAGVAHLVVDPTLEPGWCRVSNELLNEIYKPRTYSVLEGAGYTTTIKSAKRMVTERKPAARDALREASEGTTVLLAADGRMVSRQVLGWEEPAIAVDLDTARTLDATKVVVHMPVTTEAALELDALPDRATVEDVHGGWLSRAQRRGDLVDVAHGAALDQELDSVSDPLVAGALGRTPPPIDPGKVEAFEARERERREKTRAEIEAIAKANAPPPPPRSSLEEKPINELEFSVRTFNLLENMGLFTLGKLCRRTEAELLKGRDFGRTELRETKELLAELGLSLGMREFPTEDP